MEGTSRSSVQPKAPVIGEWGALASLPSSSAPTLCECRFLRDQVAASRSFPARRRPYLKGQNSSPLPNSAAAAPALHLQSPILPPSLIDCEIHALSQSRLLPSTFFVWLGFCSLPSFRIFFTASEYFFLPFLSSPDLPVSPLCFFLSFLPDIPPSRDKPAKSETRFRSRF